MALHVLSSSPLLESRRVFTERGPSVWAWLITLAPFTVGMASRGFAFYLGIGIAVAWAISLPISTFLPRAGAALLPPIVAGLAFVTTLLTMPFDSAAFWVYSWTTLVMLLMTVPKPRREHWGEHIV
jgi:hypothetical protein